MKKCKYCQSEIDDKAKICPNCRKPQGSSAVRIIVGVFVGLFIIILLGALSSSVEKTIDEVNGNKCYITLEEFNKIKSGMTYKQVVDIVGCDGTVVSESTVMGSKMTIYSWYGKDGISNANVNINDNKLINKTQIGLK